MAAGPNTVKLLSPAKLNLMLHIVGRRSDGYHELQTLFQLLDYGDTMDFEATDSPELNVNCAGLELPPQQNLAYRAAHLLQQHSQCRRGASIKWQKQLPSGGGLGGGSSNAATTLLALNRLWDLHLSLDELAALGQQLGADVPVFVRGHSAWAEGIGEKLVPVELPERWYVVIKPACQVSTAEVFANEQLTRNTPTIKMATVFAQGGHNDCEMVVRQMYPAVDKALIWLNKFSQAKLTGTGACVFADFANKQQANTVIRQLPDSWQGFIAKGVNLSPVHAALA
ncbi:4-(cytidine 5'-diphospho)-2-C-methyl-D-erythritol kinase [Halieaceae bacterium IMCC14734]|uniref:4-diphosphocytidyl-2-C-methyl-D-erythritol kinase n=1 Tax=Candidatus Litorirhabdus singularis TaxID=2518993 RepID=A0ABT3TJT4_9GAMM|nr:4-(cytidine 5'-diphospho)-2-C-methyl-D-erythritol kinase [Candidatus Litorirhabdus singularis]MCX2982485.1 4-(cytidine 5'-diphospho)-2-C-methyl-D-erythritol kinase [Candidatus Litorirhabdus singularis]